MSPGHIDGLFYLVLAVCLAGGILGAYRLLAPHVASCVRIYREAIERNR